MSHCERCTRVHFGFLASSVPPRDENKNGAILQNGYKTFVAVAHPSTHPNQINSLHELHGLVSRSRAFSLNGSHLVETAKGFPPIDV